MKNGNFDEGLTNWAFYNATGGIDPDPSSGALVCNPGAEGSTNPSYMYQVNQKDFSFTPGIDYVFGFQAWADNSRMYRAVIEASSSGLPWSGTSLESTEGAAWNLELTTEPVNYIYHINFNDLNDTPKLSFYFAESSITVNLDSIFLVTKEDYDLIISTGTKSLAFDKSLKLYPNPVNNAGILNVESIPSGSRVSIYNSIGQKLMEKRSDSNSLKFDVSGLRKGMYFVRLGNGTSEKFIMQ